VARLRVLAKPCLQTRHFPIILRYQRIVILSVFAKDLASITEDPRSCHSLFPKIFSSLRGSMFDVECSMFRLKT